MVGSNNPTVEAITKRLRHQKSWVGQKVGQKMKQLKIELTQKIQSPLSDWII
jgi:hypothetical protein